MRRARSTALFAALLLVPAVGHAQEGERVHRAAGFPTSFPVAAHRVLDADGDGRADLVAVGLDGRVRVFRGTPEGLSAKPSGELRLAHPERSLLAVADLLGRGGPPQLVVVSPDGAAVHSVGSDGAYDAGTVLAARARFPLRVGRPVFADVARDVNGDGRMDLVVPRGETVELWMSGASATVEGPPRFLRAATVAVDLRTTREVEAGALSDVLESAFRVPALGIEDVNGDGRPDLVVEDGSVHAFHLQRADGTLPAQPDVSVDLRIFRDTTPEASVRLGRTLAGGDDQRYERRDLDGDGIADHVIAHRRKVWVFHGRPEGPQFTEPTRVLKVDEDVTMLLLVRLDGDAHPDLMILRLQVPTAATILRGLVAEWGVEVAALGYASAGGRDFERTPRWRGEVEVRLPALLSVLRDPAALLGRFEQVADRFRDVVEGDFQGDGRPDLAMLDEDGRGVAVWLGARGASTGDGAEAEDAFARIFFGGGDPTWDLDRVLAWMGSVAERRVARVTGGRPADAYVRLAPRAEEAPAPAVHAADVDGDGADELVVVTRRERSAEVDVFRVR